MKLFVILVLLCPFLVNAQKIGDTQINITLTDSIDIYKKVKLAFVDLDFIIKDNYNTDTLTTYPREFASIPGLCRLYAIINGNIVTITGIYGLKRINDFGFAQSPKDYENIIYYKGSKGWELVKGVAERIGGQMAYSR